jgi:biotin carboxylase
MPRILLLLPAAGYTNQDFSEAADHLGIEIVSCADYCHRLAPSWGLPPIMSVPFDQPDIAIPIVLASLKQPVDAVVTSDDHGVQLAARLRQELDLPGSRPEAVACLADKLFFRELQVTLGLPHPSFSVLPGTPDAAAMTLRFPLVVKARRLSASRGVIRVDSMAELRHAVHQIRRIQARLLREANALSLLVESFIPGDEIALEGVLRGGHLDVLAIFDKPDPLNGPYFEESRYVTPSRLPAAIQRRIAGDVSRICNAAGVSEGVIHAEARINVSGIYLLEVAPRGIGGMCGRVLEATLGMGSAEIILRHAARLPVPAISRAIGAAGVMMIPIPATGILKGVDSLDAARAVPHVCGIEITAAPGQIVAPPPDGASYLGFIFSRADTPETAAEALRAAHAKLSINIQPLVN